MIQEFLLYRFIKLGYKYKQHELAFVRPYGEAIAYLTAVREFISKDW
ncbi:hypothetical protein [Chlorogloeopsis sp. ULAP02]